MQKQYTFVALPVVNYYFDVLKAAVEHVSGPGAAAAPLGQPEQAEFAAFIIARRGQPAQRLESPRQGSAAARKARAFGQAAVAAPDAGPTPGTTWKPWPPPRPHYGAQVHLFHSARAPTRPRLARPTPTIPITTNAVAAPRTPCANRAAR
ncbi:MAG: hypothetical protein WKG07_43220 [Hymenobacter sp.]